MIVGIVFVLFIAHAALALRKFPSSYRQYRTYREHMADMKHDDTTLWYWQVVTGFALFFMASVHLYIMLTRPDRIGPFESAEAARADRDRDEGIAPALTLAEAEDAIGINDWIDPETGEPAEGRCPPHLDSGDGGPAGF